MDIINFKLIAKRLQLCNIFLKIYRKILKTGNGNKVPFLIFLYFHIKYITFALVKE